MAPLFSAQKGKTTAAVIRSLDRTRIFNFGMGRVNLIFGSGDEGARTSLQTDLRRFGFSGIHSLATAGALPAALGEGCPDLLICDQDLPGGDVCGLIRQARNGEFGANPFLLVVTLLRDPTLDRIRRAVDAGSDAILAAPVAPAALVGRVARLIHDRKPFVVTTDYVGPTRRDAIRDGSRPVPLLDVPNSASLKVERCCSGQQIRRLIHEACRLVDGQKLDRHARQVGWQVQRILDLQRGGWPAGRLRPHLEKLTFLAGDIRRRLDGCDAMAVADMCASLAGVCARLLDCLDSPDARAVALLPPIAAGIGKAFSGAKKKEEAVREVTGRVAQRFGPKRLS